MDLPSSGDTYARGPNGASGPGLRRRHAVPAEQRLAHLIRHVPPAPKVSLWAKIKRSIRYYRTPLQIRYSIAVLRKRHHHPYLRLARLFWPIPWRQPCTLPAPPREIMAYDPQAYMDKHYTGLYELRLIPIWKWRDTPQRSFFRLYEAFCAGDSPCISYETEYFWKRRSPEWAPRLLADPLDYGCVDPEQYAVMASLAEDLVDAFNWRLEWGLRSDGNHTSRQSDGTPAPFEPEICPEWTKKVRGLDERFVLHDMRDPELTASNPHFIKRNIQASGGSLRTV